MERIELKKGIYRGLVTEVARTLGKRESNVYARLFYEESVNIEKETFVRLKDERDRKAAEFKNALRKAV